MKKNVWFGIAATVLLITALVVVGVIFYNIGISRGVSTAADLEGFVFPGSPLSHRAFVDGGAEGFPVPLTSFPPLLYGASRVPAVDSPAARIGKGDILPALRLRRNARGFSPSWVAADGKIRLQGLG